MPTLTRWFIKGSFLYLIAALLLALALAVQPIVNLSPNLSYTSPVYFHLLMVGWVSQLIFGVVFWMFPKLSSQNPRGSLALGWATFILLNAGLILRAIAEPQNQPGSIWGWLLVGSALLQWLAGLLFVGNTWNRVKGK